MEMPTLDPWTPYASLLVDGTIIPNSGVVLLNAKDLHLMENAYRCYQFTFPFSTEGSLSGKATLRLENLWLELGRGQFDAKTIAEVKNRVQQAAPGLEFEIVSESGKGGGGGYFNIISLPQNMNEADALKIIQQMTLDEYLINWQSEISFK
ncbi:hypothetical protein GW781_14105 [bacterium]|nr:hypothetical protein [bacterium]NCT22272.1 hypothetical protein [bacterium]